MPKTKISQHTANFLLSKVQEVLDEKNGNPALSSEDKDVLLRVAQDVERLLSHKYMHVDFNVITGKVSFAEELPGKQYLGKMTLTYNVPGEMVWSFAWDGRNSSCFYVEAKFDFTSHTWGYRAYTYYSKRATNFTQVRVGSKKLLIKDIHTEQANEQHARTIAYSVVNSTPCV